MRGRLESSAESGINGLILIVALAIAIIIYKVIGHFINRSIHPLLSMLIIFVLWTVVGWLLNSLFNRIFGDPE